jgi:hypothetical protein
VDIVTDMEGAVVAMKEVTTKKGKQATGRTEDPRKDDVPLGCSGRTALRREECGGYDVCYATASVTKV